MKYFIYLIILLLNFIFPIANANSIDIPILCYHNLNPKVRGSMNMTPEKFETQIQWLHNHGFHVVPLKDVVEYLLGTRSSLPEKPVVITADDGWESVMTYMYPIVKKYNIPVTLFIYPSTISVGKHALTWDQLKQLQQTGLFDIQGHTYWHPNFKQERKHLSPDAFRKFVEVQLVKSKNILEQKLNKKVTLLAWPFGIYDKYLEEAAANAGYEMAFSIDDEIANRSYNTFAQPRFMIIEGESMSAFAHLVSRR